MKLLSIFIIALSLSGCLTSKVSSYVVRYHDQNSFQYGESVAVILNSTQQNNLEYKDYKKSIQNKLKSYGYHIESDKNKAHFILTFNLKNNHSGVKAEIINNFNTQNRIDSLYKKFLKNNIQYSSILEIQIIDNNTNLKVLETTVKNQGYFTSATSVKDCLLNAIFIDFPGHNGSIDTYELEPINCSIY